MQHAIRRLSVYLFLVLSAGALGQAVSADETTRPKIRAITAFVRLDQHAYRKQVDEALAVLRAARDSFAKQGYETETLRIVTQPLAQLVAGQSEAQALSYLKNLDDLGVKEKFIPNVGPAMMRDTDDPATMRLLEKALSTLPTIQSSTSIADDEGIHWKVIHETATLVHYLTEHSPKSQGNFSFTATAMLKPYGPFYPGAWHDGPGKQFSIGLEGAGIVQDVFAQTHGDFGESVFELTLAHARSARA